MKRDSARFVIEVHDKGLRKWVRAVGQKTPQFYLCWTRAAAREMTGGIAERTIAFLAPTAKAAGVELRIVEA